MAIKERLDYVDAGKAIGILLVILGHTYYGPQVLYNIIYCFHMPLFFIIAGFTWNKEKYETYRFAQFAIKKAKELMLPYFVFASANMAIQIMWKTVLLHETIDAEYIAHNIKGILLCYSSKEHMPNCSTIWFLMCLFLADQIFYWLMHMNIKYRLILVFCCLGCSYVFSLYPYEYDRYVWKFPVFLMAVFLMFVGYVLRQCVFNNNKYKNAASSVICIGIILAAFSIEVMTGNRVGMNENQYGSLPVFLFTSIFVSASLLMLCHNITVLNTCRPLLWLGRNTIYIVGFNFICRDLAIEIYYRIPFLAGRQINFPILFIITLGLCLLMILVCRFVSKPFIAKQRA